MCHGKARIKRQRPLELPDRPFGQIVPHHHLSEHEVRRGGIRRHKKRLGQSCSRLVPIAHLQVAQAQDVGAGRVRVRQPRLHFLKLWDRVRDVSHQIIREAEQLHRFGVPWVFVNGFPQVPGRPLIVVFLIIKLAKPCRQSLERRISALHALEKLQSLVGLSLLNEIVRLAKLPLSLWNSGNLLRGKWCRHDQREKNRANARRHSGCPISHMPSPSDSTAQVPIFLLTK